MSTYCLFGDCCCFIGYGQHIRDELSEINILQNLQMARLCDIAGKNVSYNSYTFMYALIIVVIVSKTHGNFDTFPYRSHG